MGSIKVAGLCKAFGIEELFNDVSFEIKRGERVGFVGANGAGKSTLMKCLLNKVEYDKGTVSMEPVDTIGYVEQQADMSSDHTLYDELKTAFEDVLALAAAKEAMEAEIKENHSEEKLEAYGRLVERFENAGGYDFESRIRRTAFGLGFTQEDLAKQVANFSGGQKTRVCLAKALLRQPDFLFLDEPTNHMDNATVAWLEQKLLARKGALLMVTHDRYFFDRVVNRTLEIDGGKGYVYVGNYSLFLQKREERRIAEASAAQKLRNIYRRELAWISRGAEARRTKKKDRVERFAQIEAEVKNVKTEANLEMSSVSSRLGKTIIELENIGMVWDGKDYIKDFSYILLRNDRIGIVGPNGAGKSTLMDIIAGKLQPTSGEMRVGQTVKIGYFAQHSEFPDSNMRVLEYIKEANNYIETADGQRISAAQMLERFLFPPELQWVPVSKLSGGEKRRLYLLRVLMTAPNVLLLDEPTNDLDIPTLSVLEDYLDSFAGAVIAVSHDRYFLDRFAQKIFALEQDGSIKPYIGGYSDYVEALQEESAQQAQPVKAKPVAAAKPAEEPAKKKMTYGERLELERLDQEIARSEAELKMLGAEINQCGSDFTRLADLTKQQEAVQQKLDAMVDRWAYLSELAEAEG